MVDRIKSINMLIKQLQKVPYLASKNLYLVANYFLDIDKQSAEQFCATILEAKEKLEKCSICCTWKEKKDLCSFCYSDRRDKTIVCVVQTWRDLIALEKAGGYNGVYHVLGGVLSPLDGIGPEDLAIDLLISRIKNAKNNNSQNIKEIIFALSQTAEGEATASYIAFKLKDLKINITCIARGLPIGSSLEYMDKLTVYKALSERRPF